MLPNTNASRNPKTNSNTNANSDPKTNVNSLAVSLTVTHVIILTQPKHLQSLEAIHLNEMFIYPQMRTCTILLYEICNSFLGFVRKNIIMLHK